MIHASQTADPDLLDPVLNLVRDRLPADQADQASEFVRRFYRDVDPADIRDRAAVDRYGAAISHWRFAGQRRPDETLLRIYNPRTDEHGWQSPHTVIEIVHRDMPFLVDSVRMEINALGFISHLIIHPVIACRRDAAGRLLDVMPRSEAPPDAQLESCMHLEISRETDEATLDRLRHGLTRTLADVRAAVDDWPAMIERMTETIEAARLDPPKTLPTDDVAEGLAMLEWMLRDRFTFLGCRDYDLVQGAAGTVLRPVAGSGLGLMRDEHDADAASFGELPTPVGGHAGQTEFLTLTKGGARS